MFAIHARELQVDADVAACGTHLPFNGIDGKTRTFQYLFIGPAFATHEDKLGVFEYACKPSASAPYPPAFVVRDILSVAKRHPRGPACTEAQAVERRVAAARGWLRQLPPLPASGWVEETDTRMPALECIARVLLERYALRPDEAAVLIATSFRDVVEPAVLTIVQRIAREQGALWPWDDLGAPLDAAAREEELARQREEEQRAKEAEDDARPNTRTCAELGVFVTRRREKAAATPLAPAAPHYTRDEMAYAVFDAKSFLGLDVPPGPFDDTNGEVLPSDYVIPMSKGELRELRPHDANIAPAIPIGSAGVALVQWRKGKIDSSPVTEARTLRDPEGAWLVREIAHLFEPFAAKIIEDMHIVLEPYAHERRGPLHATVRSGSRLMPVLVQMYARNGIRKDVAWHALVELLTPAYESATPGDPSEVLHPEETVWTDSAGGEYEECPVALTDTNDQPLTVAEKTVPAVYWRRPPLPLRQADFEREFDAAVRGGAGVVIGKDELLKAKPTDATALEKFVSMFRPDPWRRALSKFKAPSAPVTTAEIETELRAVGQTERLDQAGFTRIAGIMQRLGKKKGQRMIDGRRQACWVDASEGDNE